MRSNRVRIIGGEWRSRLIAFPASQDLRPSADRVRETLFNWLGQDMTGKSCLDLFAGSGALGFEAASRGARCVTMNERDTVTFKALQDNCVRLGATTVELQCADALEFLQGNRYCYDVIFLDPPFKAGYWPRLLPLLPKHMAPGAVVYYESAAQPELPAGWKAWKKGRAGQVTFQLLKRTENE
jgi:16S rRNA (guanine(966)-N(2))-methyltransferase RsmD